MALFKSGRKFYLIQIFYPHILFIKIYISQLDVLLSLQIYTYMICILLECILESIKLYIECIYIFLRSFQALSYVRHIYTYMSFFPDFIRKCSVLSCAKTVCRVRTSKYIHNKFKIEYEYIKYACAHVIFCEFSSHQKLSAGHASYWFIAFT